MKLKIKWFFTIFSMEECTLINVNNCLNTNIYSYLETSGGQSSNIHVHFLTPVLIRHLWHLKTAVFLHWCLIHALPFFILNPCTSFVLFLSQILFLIAKLIFCPIQIWKWNCKMLIPQILACTSTFSFKFIKDSGSLS